MSGFESYETSQQGGRPLYLYEFQLGTVIDRFNNTESTVEVLSQDWLGEAITHTKPEVSPEARTQTIKIRLPASNAFVGRFVTKSPSEKAVVLIRKAHRGDLTDPKVWYQGLIRNIGWEKNTHNAFFIVLPQEGYFRKKCPRLGFSAQCGAMIFDNNCGVIRSSYLYNGTASNVSGNTLQVNGLDIAKGAGWATVGEIVVVSTGERRMVLEHTATDTLRLLSPFDVNPNGEAVEVTAGCDGTLSDCHSKFGGNVPNFQGWPHVSPKNIFVSGVK